MENKPITRREFFKRSFVGMGDTLKETANAVWGPEQPEIPKPELIRPPGALSESEFLEKCTRCNECVKVCPEESIMKFIGEGSPNHLTPMLSMRKSACVLCEDFPCVQVCEPRALVMPESPRHVKMGTAVINTKLCYAWQGSDCDYCLKECPFNGEAIFTDDSRRPHINEEICTGCGLCENVCPTRQPAIIIKRQI